MEPIFIWEKGEAYENQEIISWEIVAYQSQAFACSIMQCFCEE